MAKRRKVEPHWELLAYGVQREQLEADLLAQIVVMLGRQLAEETMTDAVAPATSEESDS
ncbi:hypothetical protein L6E12_03795 [Actinokineospora sp. PR83]|uniref:hypothetical protein n=1 Tax=Actinokineospora sp. PR83 TaxID=2884908 RepID=UPI001F26C0A2|nr:hypothetical protein [Actinokineospora sp. PR83]MCG8914912.1 hypothetical protein [Actinokineospora sp. PR83]